MKKEHTHTQILNDPTLPMTNDFDSRRSNRSGWFLLHKTNTNCYKDHLYPLLGQFLMNIIIVIDPVCACARMFAEDDDFQREGGGMCVPIHFIWEVLSFGLSDITLFQVSLGLLDISFWSIMYADWQTGVCVSVCFMTLIYYDVMHNSIFGCALMYLIEQQ